MEEKKRSRILIIEDNEFLGEVLKVKLSQAGYEIIWEKDGESGLSAIRETTPDLVLLDIVLPKMNGYEVLEACSKDDILQKVPVVIISNSGEPVEIERVLQLGAKDYLVKADFSPDEVLEKVEKELGVPNAPAQITEGVGTSNDGSASENQPKILVVEDDDFLRGLMGKKLSKRLKNVSYATDGKEALALATQVKPDLMLLDLIIPGMSGFQVLEQVKGNPELKDTPVIILSNLGGEEKIQKGKDLGAADFLIKANYSIDEIIAKMREYVTIPD